MAEVSTKGSNGVSYSYIHEVTAQDAIDNIVTIDFNVSLPLAFIVQVVDSSGVIVDLADAVITRPANGQVKIENGASTFVITETDKISVIAQFARGDV